jgi:hypothetical protein
MRDLDALLTSLVSIDREGLIAILSSEADHAERLAKHIRQRTASQRAKKREAIERVAQINRILQFIRHEVTASEMSEADLTLCRFLEDKLRGRATS